MKTVVLLVIGILAAIGFGGILAEVQRWVLKPRVAPPLLLVLPVQGKMENIEQLLRSARSALLRGSYGKTARLFVVDFGTEEEVKRLCRVFCRYFPAAHFCTEEELPALLRQGLQNDEPVLY